MKLFKIFQSLPLASVSVAWWLLLLIPDQLDYTQVFQKMFVDNLTNLDEFANVTKRKSPKLLSRLIHLIRRKFSF